MAFLTTGLTKFSATSSEEGDEEDIPSILEANLTTLTLGQRVALSIAVATLCICSVFGNLGTLYAHKTRKLRVFFRTCLISLALSDLITSLFTSLAYLAQFGAISVQIWSLGGLLCRMIPFLTTGAILVSSMTLLGIAFDRYYAVMRAASGFWKFNKTYSILLMLLIWCFSFVLAIHVFFAYSIYQVYIIAQAEGSSEPERVYLVAMCVSSKEANAYYYLFVLAIIFVPTLVAFVWLNSIIANKLWIRRHSFKPTPMPSSLPKPFLLSAPTMPATPVSPSLGASEPKEKQMEITPQQYQRHNQPLHHHQHHRSQHPRQHSCHCLGDNKICVSSTLTVPTSLPPSTGTAQPKSSRSNVDGDGMRGADSTAKRISTRETRHLRMFTIILILMAVFIFFRLPAWIFLIMRMYGSYTRRIDWILHFSFGILTLTSCVLNPLLYTFLAETIRYAILMKGKLCGLRAYFASHCCCRCQCHCCLLRWLDSATERSDSQKMTQIRRQNANQSDSDKGSGTGTGTDKDRDNASVNTNAGNNDCISNDGAKSNPRQSDDDSKVCAIIPVAPVGPRGWRARGIAEHEDWCQC